jgi:CheY-like chemotaxis protein
MPTPDVVNRLPYLRADDGSIASPLESPAEGGRSGGNLLIVDPAAARRWRILQVLGDLAVNVSEASSTSEGLSILLRQPVDLILMDLRAPEIGAANFCREVRKVPGTKFMQIFVLAESDSLEAEVSTIEAGANEFLVAHCATGPYALVYRVIYAIKR